MRKIKFRGKRKDNGKWIYGDLINNLHTKKSYILTYERYKGKEKPNWCCAGKPFVVVEYEIILETAGQYIGLNNNRKEIYEGDIMKLENLPKGIPTNYKVIFEDGKFTCAGMEIPYVLDFCNGKVIGNIYNNSKALIGDKDE